MILYAPEAAGFAGHLAERTTARALKCLTLYKDVTIFSTTMACAYNAIILALDSKYLYGEEVGHRPPHAELDTPDL